MIKVLSFALVLASLAAAQQPQSRPKSSHQITPTRTVRVFTELEHELSTALHSRDQAALDRLLLPEFEVRRASSPGVPVPRADFLAEQHAAAADLGQMAVRLLGSTALVSFVAAGSTDTFIVDAWLQDGPSYKLAARYQSPSTAPATQSPAGDKRPTGRD
ncbi:MAG: hypothetical protein JO187_10410 [Acidobacteria bacterium]|nr:hypothetical protein [Acidobacteriota bacterium]